MNNYIQVAHRAVSSIGIKPNHKERDDCVGAALLRMVERNDNIDQAPTSHLMNTGKQGARDYLRGQLRQDKYVEKLGHQCTEEFDDSPHAEAQVRELCDRLRQGLEEVLKAHEKQLIDLWLFDQRSYAEVATQLEITIEEAKNNIWNLILRKVRPVAIRKLVS